MNSMMSKEVFQPVCEAALLKNHEARDFLCYKLDHLPADSEGEVQLISALAWVSPDDALRYYERSNGDASRNRMPSSQSFLEYIKELQEAYRFSTLSAEEQDAYQAITALLPEHSPEKKARQEVPKLSRLVHLEPEEDSGGEYPDKLTFFSTARLYLKDPELWGTNLATASADVPQVLLGFWALEARASPSDIELVAKFLQRRCKALSKPLTNNELFYLTQVLDFLEPRVPEKLIPVVPDMLRIIDLERNENSATLMARVLVLIARLGLSTDKTILPLLRHSGHSQVSEQSQHWSRQVQQHMENFTPVPREAYELVNLL